jgi:hypothetical protein
MLPMPTIGAKLEYFEFSTRDAEKGDRQSEADIYDAQTPRAALRNSQKKQFGGGRGGRRGQGGNQDRGMSLLGLCRILG